jgi:hypothetical protein
LRCISIRCNMGQTRARDRPDRAPFEQFRARPTSRNIKW